MWKIIEMVKLIEEIGVMLFKTYNMIEDLVHESKHLDDNDKEELIKRIRKSQNRVKKWNEL